MPSRIHSDHLHSGDPKITVNLFSDNGLARLKTRVQEGNSAAQAEKEAAQITYDAFSAEATLPGASQRTQDRVSNALSKLQTSAARIASLDELHRWLTTQDDPSTRQIGHLVWAPALQLGPEYTLDLAVVELNEKFRGLSDHYLNMCKLWS